MSAKLGRWLVVLLLVLLLAVPVLAKPKTPPGQAKWSEPTTIPTTTATTSSEPTITKASTSSATETSTSNSTGTASVENGTNWEMVGAIVGILVALSAGVGWYFSYMKKAKTSKYMKAIRQILTDNSDRSKCEAKLYLLRDGIERDFSDGKIDEHSLDLLQRRIDRHLKELRMGTVNKLDISAAAKKEIAIMLKDGKVSEDEFESFTKSKVFSKTDIGKVKDQLARWKGKDKVKKVRLSQKKR